MALYKLNYDYDNYSLVASGLSREVRGGCCPPRAALASGVKGRGNRVKIVQKSHENSDCKCHYYVFACNIKKQSNLASAYLSSARSSITLGPIETYLSSAVQFPKRKTKERPI